MRQRASTILLSTFFSALLLFTTGTSASYLHYHTLADGSIVFHVHPFDTSDSSGQHQHTKSDFEFLAFTGSISFTENFASSAYATPVKETEADYFICKCRLHPVELIRDYNNRAPPA